MHTSPAERTGHEEIRLPAACRTTNQVSMLFPTMDGPLPDSPVGELDALRAALAHRYTIERVLGHGGMATVYLADDVRHHRQVAVKVLGHEFAHLLGRDRFLREIEIAAHLQHPHIVPLFDSGEAGGFLYYVMPAVEGETLRERLSRDIQLPVDEALRIVREVADALDYAHAHGVIHRDIKPENIFLAGGHALVADFGIARVLQVGDGNPLPDPGDAYGTPAGVAVGTPHYMSPEQASAGARVDGRSDVYALGCVLYEMLGGQAPFPGRTHQAILARHLLDPVPSLRVVRPTISPSVQVAIERALAKVPADRYATAGAFAEALTRAPRVAASALALAAVGLIAVMAGAFWFSRSAGPSAQSEPSVPDPDHVAVLYFHDESQGGTLRHLAKGLTEDLIDELSRVQALHVISPGGVRQYRDSAIRPGRISQVLNVGTVVDGGVVAERGQLVVTVRLVDAVTERQLGSTRLERPLGDLFALQREAAEEVARFLRQRLGRTIELHERHQATMSVSAWEAVQRAESFLDHADALARSGSVAEAVLTLNQADSLLARAERIDRAWSEPTVQRGWISRVRADLANSAEEPMWLQQGMVHADRALTLHQNDPGALELRGYLMFRLSRVLPEWEGQPAASLVARAQRDLRAAVASDPSRARAWNVLGLLHYMTGEFREARITLRRGLEADAYLTEAATNLQLLFFTTLETGNPDSARAWCALGVARFVNDPRFAQCDLIVLGWTGRSRRDIARAWDVLDGLERRDSVGALLSTWGFRRMMVAAIIARAGLVDSAENVVRTTRASAPSEEAILDLDLYEAYVFATLGDRDRVLERLGAYLDRMPHDAAWVSRTRWFAPLHDDARFRTLVHVPHPDPSAS